MENSIKGEDKITTTNYTSKMEKIIESQEIPNRSKTVLPKNNPKNNDSSINIEDGDELESEEESYIQDSKEIPVDLSKEQIKKIMDLKALTEDTISKTVKYKNSSNMVKSLVSKKKNRFCYDGFDLDLSYITERIIAMGLPSTNLEGLYRNSMDEVQNFLNTRHPLHYKVYNLCEERDYPKNSFYKQGVFPFKDHEAPPLNLIKAFCEDAKKFLDENYKNMVAIHCKAGKGRTGTMICCLLMYMNIFETAKEALYYYGIMRVENAKGVTIPSQIRYINYFEQIIKEKMPHPIKFKKKLIKKVTMFTLPMFGKSITLFFKIKNNEQKYKSEKKKNEIKKEEISALVDFDIEKGFLVQGDVNFIFYRNKFLTDEKIFKFWFNTNFIPNDCNIYQFKKEEIDKACKDKKCKYYSPLFKIEVYFIDA